MEGVLRANGLISVTELAGRVLDELPLAALPQRALALHLVAPVVAVPRRDPAALAPGTYRLRSGFATTPSRSCSHTAHHSAAPSSTSTAMKVGRPRRDHEGDGFRIDEMR